MLLVVAALVERDGKILMTLRGEGTHLAGHWEFPGGKIEPGETPPAALARELEEELGTGSRIGDPFAFSYHEYPERRVLLLVYRATLVGDPRPLGCARLGWFTRQEVARLQLPAADAPIVARLLGEAAISG